LKHPNDNPGARYIEIDSADINKPFKVKQDDHLKFSPGGNGVFHTASGQNSDDVKFGLLFSLAHELAHIKWHEAYPLTAGTGSGISCYDDKFAKYWDRTDNAKMNRWTQYGQANLGVPKGVVVPPGQASPDQLFDIYNKGFATGLAAANPEEDFVEAYSLGVVNLACRDCLFSINSAAGSTTLSNRQPVDAKIACAAGLYF
jgi:hypothetical protein